MKFRDLAIGEVFEFSSRGWKGMGLAQGPWVKVSAQKYDHSTDPARKGFWAGTVGVEVIPLCNRGSDDPATEWVVTQSGREHVCKACADVLESNGLLLAARTRYETR